MTAKVFKNDRNRWITKALFYELSPINKDYCVYTLKNEDVEIDGTTYWSLRKRFVESEDPTEYEFANKWLGGWAHWKELQQCDALKEHIEEWREERDIRFQSMGVKRLVDMATDAQGTFQAAKWLADKGWIDKEPTRGRPTKAEVNREARRKAGVSSKLASDLERIRKIG